MGTIPAFLPKNISFQQENIGLNTRNAMAYPGGGGDETPQYNYIGLKCEGQTVVCKGTSDEDANGKPTNWKQIPHSICSDRQRMYPGSLDVPNCSRSRDLPGAGSGMSTKQVVVMGAIGLGVLGLAIVIIKMASKSA